MVLHLSDLESARYLGGCLSDGSDSSLVVDEPQTRVTVDEYSVEAIMSYTRDRYVRPKGLGATPS